MDAFLRWKLSAAVVLPALLMAASFAVAAPDRAVQPATYQSVADVGRATTPPQKLNEPMPIGPSGRESGDPAAPHGGHRDAPATPSAAPALLSMFGSLAVVIGLFLGLVWLLRRGAAKSAKLLSGEVVEVLGRSPLAGRQHMHVIRFGNRLLLVAVSPDGAETLAEVSDPAEVDRLAGLCQQTQPNSATHAFRQVFGQLAEMRRPRQLDAVASIDVAAIGSREPTTLRHAEDDDV